ncbi:two-component regulator propeller domain-containing protein [Chitinophaga pinensis]|uniref:Hybrid sensor histidine kinase/response regulator n=1 Tax=Chitinophaga pinensis TaxID=79329 RepID=A0A5C6LRI7_9BACT|nr:two-component regulator propeller domain-containing protein [Chitinophaga pinensis]TWV99930.1 hypothetical protein FEF09_13085 [Chitinophaga pinensis]
MGTAGDGVICYNPDSGTYQTYHHQEQDPASLSTNQVRATLCDHKGNVWVGGINGGLNLLNPNDNSFYHYQNEPESPKSLSQRTVSALFEDRQGIIWVGTHRGGINIYVPGAEKFRLYQQQMKQNSLSYNDVKAFVKIVKGLSG